MIYSQRARADVVRALIGSACGTASNDERATGIVVCAIGVGNFNIIVNCERARTVILRAIRVCAGAARDFAVYVHLAGAGITSANGIRSGTARDGGLQIDDPRAGVADTERAFGSHGPGHSQRAVPLLPTA